jgi:hypothetical protein
MKTQNRKLFNAFKEVDQLPSKWILIPRMIYEYEKSIKSNMSIFVNKGERSDMWKKI